jgi:hypothetical protein
VITDYIDKIAFIDIKTSRSELTVFNPEARKLWPSWLLTAGQGYPYS